MHSFHPAWFVNELLHMTLTWTTGSSMISEKTVKTRRELAIISVSYNRIYLIWSIIGHLHYVHNYVIAHIIYANTLCKHNITYL